MCPKLITLFVHPSPSFNKLFEDIIHICAYTKNNSLKTIPLRLNFLLCRLEIKGVFDNFLLYFELIEVKLQNKMFIKNDFE